ncbi:MAG: DUF4878 domain-containing protein [Chitinophagaceae bacterium]|nr:DUF4878 domain-containing protein [Chitinophagaceae bacterium]
MKKILSVLALSIVLFSCKTNSSGPSGAVNAFLDAMKKGDVTSIKKFVTKSDIQMLEMAESIAKTFGNEKDATDKLKNEFIEKSKDVSFTVKDEKIEGDKASVNVDVKEKDKTTTQTFKLVKEDGVWKISLLSTGMNMAGKEGVNLDNVNISDSLQKGLDKLNNLKLDSLDEKTKKFIETMKNNKDNIEKLAKEFEDAMKEKK